MSHYSVYIWLSYGITFGFLSIQLLLSIVEWQKTLKQMRSSALCEH